MSWFQKLLYGVDPAQDQKDMDAADAKLRQLNQDKLASGDWTQEQFDESNGNIARSHIDAQAEVSQAFNEGFNDGVKNIRGGIGSAINLPFKLLSWQVYVIAAVALLVYMGGWKKLKGIIK